jgi:hypothetical protein
MLPFSSHKIVSINPILKNQTPVRTGIDADGNCFFHSYLYSVEAPTYKDLPYDKRLQRAMEVKHFFADLVTIDDILDIIDIVSFETIQGLIEKHLKGYQLPDLSKQPLLSLRSYLLLVYDLYPHLTTDQAFQYMIYLLQNEYVEHVKQYIKRGGSWMIDSYIELFMKKLKINIILYSFETNKKITHYRYYDGPLSICMYHITDHFESIGSYDISTQKMTRIFKNNEIENSSLL